MWYRLIQIYIKFFRTETQLSLRKVGLYHRPNQINEMNDSGGGRCFEPFKIGTRTRRNLKFGNNVHNYLNNQEMSCILKYFSFYGN